MAEENNFFPHEAKWNKEKVSRFWDYFAHNQELVDLDFAREAGNEIIDLLEPYIERNGRNLDYGCGTGHLLGYLFARGYNGAGLDSSAESIKKMEEKYNGNRHFQGAVLSSGIPNPIKDSNFDFCFFLETIEHILPNELDLNLKEINRLLKPGGYLFVSTPNKEKLDRNKVICPDCGCIFHWVQHMNSFNVETLSNIMRRNGFETVFCREVFLGINKGWFNKAKKIANQVRNFWFKTPPNLPHLIYLGKKK